MTLQGELLGTPAYMAPEQALGWIDRVDERTDVYGLAAILYEILTGEPPFRGPKLDAVIQAIVKQPPVPPSTKVAGVPAALERVCLQGLAKHSIDRPASAAELGAAVRGWLTAQAEQRRIELERERFFDLSLDLLAIVDHRGHLGQSNAAWERLLGVTAEARATAAFLDLVDPAQRAEASAALEAIWAGADHAAVEVRMRSELAGVCWVDWSLRSIPDEQAIYMVGRDVTERRRSEREFEGLLESAPDATCVIDESGAIVRVNAQLERMFGYPRAELLGQPVERLVPVALRDRHRHHVDRYVVAPKLRPMGGAMSLQGQRSNGEVFPIEVSLSPVPTDERLLIACTLREPRARPTPSSD
jgi:serine/threonine-protein kinase